MPIHNADIALIFDEIAVRLEIQGANPFRIRAYRNAARNLLELPHEARVLLARGEDLTRFAWHRHRSCRQNQGNR